MSLLSTPLPLLGGSTKGGIDDAERFARSSANDALRRMGSGARLNLSEYEDLLAFLIGELWELSQRYDPTRGSSFAKFAHDILPRRATSWYRKRFRDTRYGRKTHVRPLPNGAAELWVEGRRCMALASRHASVDDAREAERHFRTAIPDSLDELTAAETPASAAIDGQVLSTINTDLLTPTSRMTFEHLLRPHVEEDLTLEQVGARRGWGRRRVAELMKTLRDELEAKCLAA